MAMKFYNVEKVAEILGISAAQVNDMRERQELHGYRDGANWKFKAEEIDALAAKRAPAEAPEAAASEDEDVLLSEVELGQSDPSTSGTVIGPPPSEALGSALSGFEDLDLSIAESGLDMSGLDMSSPSQLTGASELDLSASDLDDDDLVLGAGSSGGGSDLTIGGDSGISLLDPAADSGLSLDEVPLDLAGSSHGSLDLGGDQVALADKRAGSESPTDLGTDGDFTLTPMDELGEGEDDSSSQVITLDEEDSSGELLGAPPMLDGDIGEPLGARPPLGRGVPALDTLEIPTTGPAVTTSGVVTDYSSQTQGTGAAALPEAPYTALNIVGLAFCTIILLFVGMMLYDLARNMWSWNQPPTVNSWLMDLILGR